MAKSGVGLLIGGLFGIAAIIVLEQKKPAAASPNQPSASSMNAAAQNLPQFSQGADPSVVDAANPPTFDGTSWNCSNGDIPYYDPVTKTVCCVFPGMTVGSVSVDQQDESRLIDESISYNV